MFNNCGILKIAYDCLWLMNKALLHLAATSKKPSSFRFECMRYEMKDVSAHDMKKWKLPPKHQILILVCWINIIPLDFSVSQMRCCFLGFSSIAVYLIFMNIFICVANQLYLFSNPMYTSQIVNRWHFIIRIEETIQKSLRIHIKNKNYQQKICSPTYIALTIVWDPHKTWMNVWLKKYFICST